VVEKGAEPQVSPVRRRLLRAARALTTPLLPDDYIALMNPLWSTRELTGTIERIQPETPDASTIVIRPSFPWPGHQPGQYLRIGVEINGIRHWRAYSLTSDPNHPDGLVSITVKHVPTGKMSPYFTRQAEPGSIVFLGEVEGTFSLHEPPPAKSLFISAGSGITPIMSMLRELDRRAAVHDVVHLHCARATEDFIFVSMMRDLAERRPGYTLHEHLSSEKGRISPSDLDELCPDWREREGFLSGPGEMLDAMMAHWAEHGDIERLRMERFQPTIGTGGAAVGEGGTVRFRVTDVDAVCGPGVSILVGGEEAGGKLTFGCRMGICHTCVGRLCSGRLRDLRTGEVHGEQGETVRICVNAPEGNVEVDL
jgi:stearoyl-CoA 9-desaturase NADPH oxidoreductase